MKLDSPKSASSGLLGIDRRTSDTLAAVSATPASGGSLEPRLAGS